MGIGAAIPLWASNGGAKPVALTLALATCGVLLLLGALVNDDMRLRAQDREIRELKVLAVGQDDRLKAQQELLKAAAAAMERQRVATDPSTPSP